MDLGPSEIKLLVRSGFSIPDTRPIQIFTSLTVILFGANWTMQTIGFLNDAFFPRFHQWFDIDNDYDEIRRNWTKVTNVDACLTAGLTEHGWSGQHRDRESVSTILLRRLVLAGRLLVRLSPDCVVWGAEKKKKNWGNDQNGWMEISILNIFLWAEKKRKCHFSFSTPAVLS